MDTKIDGLKKYLSPFEVWALAFGCSVGWGAFVMPGTTFLPTAGPLGTAAGLFFGAIVMLIIATNYSFMMNRIPDAGGIFAYSKKIFGYDHGFLSSWFLILTYIAITWANATALTVISRKFLGETFQIGYLYTIAGYDVYLAEVFLSIAAILICGFLCVGRKKNAGLAQTFLSCLLIAGILICACDALSSHEGGLKTFEPAFFPNGSAATQIFGIVALAPWAFVGFESVSHSVEEFNFSPQKSFKIMAAAIGAAFFAYLILAEAAISILPSQFDTSWVSYILHFHEFSGIESFPIMFVVKSSLGAVGIKILGATVIAAVMTGLIGNYIGVSRLLYSMAKDNLLPASFAKLNKNNAPANTIFFVMIISLVIPFFGRTAIGWIVDVNTVGATIAYCYTSAAAFVLAKTENNRLIKITGGIGIFMSLIFVLFLLVPNIWGGSILATESYLILVLWSIFGFCVFRKIFHEDMQGRFGKSVIAWIVMLFLIFFCSLIWMRQSADKSLEKTVGNVSEFYEDELERFGYNINNYRKYPVKKYLEEQMAALRSTLLIDSVIQMAVVLFSLFMMFNIYSIVVKREKDAQHAKNLAEENSRAKTTFLSNMSHDIRTPMNAIIGYTNLARRDGVSVDEMKDFLAKIDTSSQHLLSLINDVLEMSRIESGRMELDESENNIVQIVQEIADMFATQMETKKINFVVETSAVENKFVTCDGHRLNRILLNLVSNAYKFTPEGGKISVTLTEKNFGEYELRVKDSGIGMSEEFAREVFEPFTRERTSTVSGIQGTGLGMAITKNFTDLMGGKISVKTEKGKGTEFILNFNFAVIDKVEEPEEISKDGREVDFTQKKLLLVEDVEVNREIALMILEEVGFQVDYAVNGADAVEKFSKAKPGDFDAILMDIQMPVMNGYEATKKIREFDKKIPIIAMTANAFSEDVEHAKAAGMNAHIAKPLDVPKMMETLAQVLS